MLFTILEFHGLVVFKRYIFRRWNMSVRLSYTYYAAYYKHKLLTYFHDDEIIPFFYFVRSSRIFPSYEIVERYFGIAIPRYERRTLTRETETTYLVDGDSGF